MKTTDFDRLASSVGVDRQAEQTFTMSGEADIDYCIPDNHPHWFAPPPLARIPRHRPEFVDLTGRKIGRLTVIGYLGEGKDKSRWLVRCLCGIYECRRGKAIKNEKNASDACLRCRKIAQAKRSLAHQKFKDAHGYYPHEGGDQ